MLKNLASSLILTERDAEFDDNAPKTKGRVITTVPKAKEVRPLVEKCVTLARHALRQEQAAEEFASDAQRGTEQWRQWRQSEQWQQWAAARAPAVAARRRLLQLLGNKQAVRVLFDEVAPRMLERDGGYTRILRLADRRLGDAGEQALLEFVGRNDRVRVASERPAFEAPTEADEPTQETAPVENEAAPDATEANADEAEVAADESAASNAGDSEAAADAEEKPDTAAQ